MGEVIWKKLLEVGGGGPEGGVNSDCGMFKCGSKYVVSSMIQHPNNSSLHIHFVSKSLDRNYMMEQFKNVPSMLHLK